MEYKGYIGKVDFDEDAGVFFGSVINSSAIIHFRGESVQELKISFYEGVDAYLETCLEEGIEPEKTFSGELRLRLGSELHRKAFIKSQTEGVSLNAFVSHAVEDAVSSGFPKG